MDTDKASKGWRELSAETLSGMAEWRKQHPKATLREIEKALDERMMKLRAKVLEEAAQLSEMQTWTESEDVPICPDCKKALEFRVKGKRELQTQGGHSIQLERDTASVQNADRAFFPLDEELELLPGKLTPHAHECLIRFGTIMPFAKAAKELEFVLKVGVSEPTARRYVEAAGKAYEEYQTVEVERLEKTCPPAAKNTQKMFLSVDGAMIPLVRGE